MIALPAPEDAIERLPGQKTSGQRLPQDAPFDDIEDCSEHLAQVGARPASFGGFWQQRSEIFALVEVRLDPYWAFFIASTEASASKQPSQAKAKYQ